MPHSPTKKEPKVFRNQLPAGFAQSDPARHLHAKPTLDDAALLAILASPRDEEVPDPPKVNARRRATWAVAASVGVGAIAVTALSSILAPTTAFADWTPEPVDPPADFAEQVAKVCPMDLPLVVNDASGIGVVTHETEVVSFDQRGSHAYVLAANENGWEECFVLVNQDQINLTAVGNSSYNPTPMEEIGSDELVVLGNGTSAWAAEGDEPEGSFTSVYGRAGEGVVSVELTTADGRKVQATVGNGWWSAWAPTAERFNPEVTYVTGDGVVRTT